MRLRWSCFDRAGHWADRAYHPLLDMKLATRKNLAVVLVVLIAGAIAIPLYLRRPGEDEPRREALAAVSHFAGVLRTGRVDQVVDVVVVPPAYRGRTVQEQADFLRKALRDEISAEGLAVMADQGTFGSLTNVFPDKAEEWARRLGVSATDCVAFRAGDGPFRAELVLMEEGDSYRVVRCNNVKQLAIRDE